VPGSAEAIGRAKSVVTACSRHCVRCRALACSLELRASDAYVEAGALGNKQSFQLPREVQRKRSYDLATGLGFALRPTSLPCARRGRRFQPPGGKGGRLSRLGAGL